MEPLVPVIFLGYFNIALYLAIAGLGIYILILIIKALKIYIKKNS
ncbi:MULTISPECIES: hypothetical protein [unclassified Clostridium]|jgi:hypothetical protein|nr:MULTISPECIES: hypothetical protein [unclassified Clostridium]MDU6340166.1 hypothetical protein [Clostridium sp.]